MCLSDALSGPVDVQLRRISSTVLEVTWQPPAYHYHDLITGYRVYYHGSSVAPPRGDDVTDSRWEVKDVDGPLTVTQLAGLKPDRRYTVRVRARGVDRRLGNLSAAVTLDDTNTHAGSFTRSFAVFNSCVYL